MNIATRLVLLTALCCGLACAQSDYPNRAARIIYPYPPGSNGDTITRIFAKHCSSHKRPRTALTRACSPNYPTTR